MRVEVVTPEDHMGDVIGNLSSRRGVVQEFTDKPGGVKVGRDGGRVRAWASLEGKGSGGGGRIQQGLWMRRWASPGAVRVAPSVANPEFVDTPLRA